MNPNTMTCEECRDELARMDGWRIFTMPSGTKLYLAPGKPDDADCQTDCPHPPTLDGAAKALPEGWVWCKCLDVAENEDGWYGWNERTQRRSDGVFICDPITNAPDELTARYRLAVACRMEMEKTT